MGEQLAGGRGMVAAAVHHQHDFGRGADFGLVGQLLVALKPVDGVDAAGQR